MDYLVEGYATTFNEKYYLFTADGVDYYEIVDSKAIDSNTIMDDVVFQYNHQGMVYARMHNKTLKLSTDLHGLKVTADLSKTTSARNMYENISSGNVYQMSWGFIVDKSEFDKETHTRTIKHIKRILDVSAVSLPANPSTSINTAVQRTKDPIEEMLKRKLIRTLSM